MHNNFIPFKRNTFRKRYQKVLGPRFEPQKNYILNSASCGSLCGLQGLAMNFHISKVTPQRLKK